MTIQFATTRLTTGPRIHFAEKGDSTGQPIVFVHGWPDSWFSFSQVLRLLPEDYHALAFDQRGFGDSERPECCYTVDALATDVVAFLDAVGLERASLVGHSAGSFVIRRVAETQPQRVERLILVGSAVTVANEVTRQLRVALDTLADPVPVEFVRELQSTYVPLPLAFFDEIVSESCKLPARVWREVADGMLAFDDAAELGQIEAPTLILWGEQDPLFPRQEQDRLAEAIPGSRLMTYAETGHCPNWERPERMADDLDGFMRKT
jgi:non-heme chloroperoxidase